MDIGRWRAPSVKRVAGFVWALALAAASCGGAPPPPLPSIAVPGGSNAGCGVMVPVGGDISQIVATAVPGAVICLAPGHHTVASTIRPLSGQTLRGTGDAAPTLTCSVEYCIDGLGGGTGVTVSNLVLEGARVGDLRTSDGWTLNQVEATTAGEAGLKLQGTNVTARYVYAVADGRFGIVAKDATDIVIDHAFVADSPNDPSFGDGFSSGLKLNFVDGATITNSTLSDANGGAALWLDNNTQHFTLSSNTIERADHDAIRVEISCDGTIEGNTITGAGNVGIDLFNAHDVVVTGNSVAGAGTWPIRMLGNGRSQGPGGGACLDQGTYATVRNVAEHNQIVLAEGNSVGVQRDGGVIADLSWAANRYSASSCLDANWTWWTGTGTSEVAFSSWQGFGLDMTGSCADASPS
jgi:parallel beta-helix repeat protein